MRNGLSLKWVISGSFLLLIAVVLLIYSLLLPEYSVRGLLYTASAMMEEEAQYFARHYNKDPTTPPPHNYFYTSVIGKEALPGKVRQLLDTPPSLSFGAVQVFGDLDSDDDDEGRAILAQPLADGKTLYMYDVDHDQEEGGEVETPLSDAYLDRELHGVIFISLAVFIPALIIIALLVWWLVRPLGRLSQWSSTLKDPDTVAGERPNFSFKEFNMLADALAQSMQQVQAASLREGRLLRYTSHELRTPLAVLKANIELLTLQSGGALPPPPATYRTLGTEHAAHRRDLAVDEPRAARSPARGAHRHERAGQRADPGAALPDRYTGYRTDPGHQHHALPPAPDSLPNRGRQFPAQRPAICR